MKYLFILSTSLFLSCSNKSNEHEKGTPRRIINQEFQSILDAANVDGVILLFDLNKNTLYSNNFDKATIGHLPASTFKIPNAIIGLETGAIKNKSSIFKWDGEKRYLATWEKDLNLKQAFQLSCVPCFQSVAKNIGVKNMKSNLKKLTYGKMEVKDQNLDKFWLEGNSKITPLEQVDFLKRLYKHELPISKSTYQILKDILQIKIEGNYTLSGKTGWSTTSNIDNGWFVGFIETQNDVYFFSSNIAPGKNLDTKLFSSIRKKITLSALNKIGAIN